MSNSLREIHNSIVILEKNREAYLRYTREQMAEMDRVSELNTAIHEGEMRGIQKGRAEGIAEGIEKGMEKGKAKVIIDATLLIAKNLKSMKLPYEDISKSTGLSFDEIEKL